MFKAPKTHRSRRRVPLCLLAFDALRQHRAGQSQQRLLLGGAYCDLDLVCAAPDGQIRNPSSFSASFSRLVATARVGHLRFHDLRHSHATQLFALGVHPKIVSERLGHSTVGIALDTYSHVLPGLQDEAVAKIDGALRIALGSAEASSRPDYARS